MNNIYNTYIDLLYKYKNPESYLETKSISQLYFSLDYYMYKEKGYIKDYLNYIEKRFLQSIRYATLYSVNFLRKRWIEAEEEILTNNYYTKLYIKHIIGNTWSDKYSTDDILYNAWYRMIENKLFFNNSEEVNLKLNFKKHRCVKIIKDKK